MIKMAQFEVAGVEECGDFMTVRFEFFKNRLRRSVWKTVLEARLLSSNIFHRSPLNFPKIQT